MTRVLLVLAVAISSKANASAASRLLYTRTPGAAHCPDERRFRAAVAERLGYDPFFPWAEQTITVDLFEEKGALRAKLALVDRDGIMRGTRVLKGRSRDCEELLTSLALAASITLDPMAAREGGAPSSEHGEPAGRAQNTASATAEVSLPAADTASRPLSSPKEEAQPHDKGPVFEVRAEAQPPVQWSVLAGPVVALGATPGASLGGRLGTQLQYGHLAFGFELRGALPTTRESDGGGAVHAGVFGGALTPCFIQGPLSACGILHLGSMQVRGSDVEIPVQTSLWFAAAGARGEVAIPIGGTVDLRAHVDGMRALLLSQLYLHGSEVWQSPPFWVAFGVSAGVRFP